MKPGIVHLGVGNFHRAHQAVFTDDAIESEGGDWGIVGVSLRHTAISDALMPQENLYTVEISGSGRRYRVVGALRETLVARRDAPAIVSALASPRTHLVTLTITEKGYYLAPSGSLDFNHPDTKHDLETKDWPYSAVGWLTRGLAARRQGGAGKLTIVSCDNLADNGGKLGRSVTAFAAAHEPSLARWIEDHASFPRTMVDCIVPAADAACRDRVAAALGISDAAPVMREAFAQWAIEDRFVAPRPAWDSVGAEIVKRSSHLNGSSCTC